VQYNTYQKLTTLSVKIARDSDMWTKHVVFLRISRMAIHKNLVYHATFVQTMLYTRSMQAVYANHKKSNRRYWSFCSAAEGRYLHYCEIFCVVVPHSSAANSTSQPVC